VRTRPDRINFYDNLKKYLTSKPRIAINENDFLKLFK